MNNHAPRLVRGLPHPIFNPFLIALVASLLLPLAASARVDEPAANSPSALANALWGILPIVLIAVFIWFFFGRVLRKTQKRGDDYMATQKLHNDRVEQLLERIAKAVENKGPNGA
jgi:ATP-dependent Zn protease